MHGLALFVFRIIGDIVLAVVVADILQHMQRKIGDRRAFLAAGIVAVDDLDNGIIVVFQTVQNDLVPVPQIVGKAFAQCLIRFQHHAVHTLEGHGFFTVFLFHSHTRFPILYTTNYFNSCPAPCQYR